MTWKITPGNMEILMREQDFIVTKTDKSGKITYANPIFIEFSGFSETELIGQQHNIVRHPDMPRAVFDLLWKTVKSGEEFFGYVKNISKNGSFYWVNATVTPSFGTGASAQDIIGFFSVRRKPETAKLSLIKDLYRNMLAAEQRAGQREAIAAGAEVLHEVLKSSEKTYQEFILTL